MTVKKKILVKPCLGPDEMDALRLTYTTLGELMDGNNMDDIIVDNDDAEVTDIELVGKARQVLASLLNLQFEELKVNQ